MDLLQKNLFDISTRIRFPVHVRPFSEFTPPEKKLVSVSGLDKYGPISSWTAAGSNRDLSYSTHGVFRYFGKFPPPIATHLIFNHTKENDLVVDPMCGSGTTGVECLLHNRNAMLFDVNPLSLLLARVKTRYIASDNMGEAVQRVLSSYNKSLPSDYDCFPVGLRNADHWFLPETIESLRRLRCAIDKEKELSIKEFLLVVLTSTVRKVSRATTQQGRLFLDAATAETDAVPTFIHRAKLVIDAIASLPQGNMYKVHVGLHDMRTPPLPSLNRKAKLVILHPPYFNGYRYSTINALEMAWLGISITDVRNAEIREYFKVGKIDNVTRYVSDMKDALLSALTMVIPEGYLALMIGDTMIRGEYIPVVRMLLSSISLTDVKIKGIALRVPRHTEASWVTSQRRKSGNLGITLCDYILLFRVGS